LLSSFSKNTSTFSLRIASILVLVENVREIYVRVLTVLVVPLLEQSLAFLVRFVPVDVDVVSRKASVFLSSRYIFAREEFDFVFFLLVADVDCFSWGGYVEEIEVYAWFFWDCFSRRYFFFFFFSIGVPVN
jgi:hypothetical protein